ncbi:MAG: exosortase/archaeosortase family protein [Kiritimatiellia bacterium]
MRNYLQSGRFVALLITVGCALFGFSAMFVRVTGLFSDELEDLSHGWLVLPFSLYVLWSERQELKRNLGAPSGWGLVACVPCLLLALLGTRGLQIRFEQLGFIGLCITVPWAFFGWRFARLFIFPALFLLFTVPLATFLDAVTIHLRLFASGTALVLLKGFGLDVVQQGTAIISQGAHPFSVDVAAPCSGMRSIFALMALTAAYAWFTQPTWLRRGVLFACSVPLAVLGNITRILTICCVAAVANADFALGFYHDYSGYIVFAVAIALMVACGGLIDRLAVRAARRTEEEAPLPPPAPTLRGRVVPWLAMALLAPAFIFQGLTPRSTITEPPSFALPEALEGCQVEEVFYCQNEQCSALYVRSQLEKGREGGCPACGGALEGNSLGERTILPADTRITKRVYATPRASFLVSAVVGGTSKSSLHRPELCMPAQGFLMRDPQDLDIGGRPFHAIRLESPRAPSTVLSYTFFNQAGVHTASHVRRILVDTWDRSVLNRIDRWVMVTVSASGADGFSLENPLDRAALESFLLKLAEKLP